MPETLFLQDVMNIPAALGQTVAGVDQTARQIAVTLLDRGARRLVAVGNGSSLYAAKASVYLHNALVGPTDTLAWAVPAGDYACYPAPLAVTDALIAVSVSGEVIDTLVLLEQMRDKHQLVGVTNQASSSLAKLVDHVLLTQAGKPLVPTSTTTYATSLAALDVLWAVLLSAQGVSEAEGMRNALLAISEAASQGLAQARKQVARAADRLTSCNQFFILGTGPSLAVAEEAALVFKEVVNLPAEPIQTREMVQGVIAMISPTVGVIAVNPPGIGHDATHQAVEQCARLGAKTLEIGPSPAHLCIEADVHELLSPLVYSIPVFVLANELAIRRGIDTDHPHWVAEYLRAVRM